MRFLYVFPHGIYPNKVSKENGKKGACITTGVYSKIQWQIDALKKNEVDTCYVDLPINLESPVSYIKSSYDTYKILKRYYVVSDDNCIIYHRSLLPFISTYLCTRKRISNSKTVYELQSIGKDEAKLSLVKKQSLLLFFKSVYVYLSTCLFERRILSRADGVVSVTNEIDSYYRTLTKNKLKYCALGNGISMSAFDIRAYSANNTATIHVLSVSGVRPWHGLDRFILGLASYSGSRDICLHIVGNGPEIPHLKELTEKYNLTSKVLFHGFKSGAELDAMFDMCQIALGSLAGFRAGLQEISSLKNREYCARGMPFIAACTDCDFPEGWPYIKMISNDDTPLDMETVISFTDAISADSKHPEVMRKYAEEHLSWDAKMKTLKEFLESL